MNKVKLVGSVEDFFVDIAAEKGWLTPLTKTAAPGAMDEITKRQYEKLIETLMGRGMTRDQAIKEIEKRYPGYFKQASENLKSIAPQNANDVEATMSKENTLQKTAVVIDELVALANDLDKMGELTAADAVDMQITLYKAAVEKLYDIGGETGEQFLNGAHPKGGVVIVPAKDEGGKVETEVEQQKKDLAIVEKEPDGKYAELLGRLIATANRLDEEGQTAAAQLVDRTIEEIRTSFPFVGRNSAREVLGSEDNKTSIKNAEEEKKQFTNIIPMWDDIMKNYWGPLSKEIMGEPGFSTNPVSGEIVKQMQAAYARANGLVDRIVDNWHRATGQQMYSLVTQMANSLKLKNTFEFMSVFFTRAANANKYAILHDQMLEKLYGMAQKFTGAEVAGAEGNKTTEGMRKEQFSKYMGTLDKIIAAIGKNPKSLLAAYGNKDPQIVDKFLQALEEEKELAKKYTWKQLMDSNEAVYNKLIPFLKKYKISVANKIYGLTKSGAGLAELLKNMPTEKPATGKPKAKGKGGGVARSQRDPQVEKLQTVLQNAGFGNLLRTRRGDGIDGIWGPATAKALNAFVDKNHGYLAQALNLNLEQGGQQYIANPEKQKHAIRPGNLQFVTNALESVRKNNFKESTSVIDIGGMKVGLENMQSAQAFVQHMQSVSGGTTAYTPTAALQHLDAISNYVRDNRAEMEGKRPGIAASWEKALAGLTREFQGYERQANTPGVNTIFQYPWEKGQTGQGQAAPASQANIANLAKKINMAPEQLSKLTADQFIQLHNEPDAKLARRWAEYFIKNPGQGQAGQGQAGQGQTGLNDIITKVDKLKQLEPYVMNPSSFRSLAYKRRIPETDEEKQALTKTYFRQVEQQVSDVLNDLAEADVWVLKLPEPQRAAQQTKVNSFKEYVTTFSIKLKNLRNMLSI